MVEEQVRKEMQAKDEKDVESGILSVLTDAEDEEMEYESWKLRELKRNKRDREEREAVERERLEVERLRNMTEEERRAELKNNPKQVTNKAPKGKYKFLQKYYHRGAFYLVSNQAVFTNYLYTFFLISMVFILKITGRRRPSLQTGLCRADSGGPFRQDCAAQSHAGQEFWPKWSDQVHSLGGSRHVAGGRTLGIPFGSKPQIPHSGKIFSHLLM